jgi:hypothetical protein
MFAFGVKMSLDDVSRVEKRDSFEKEKRNRQSPLITDNSFFEEL